MSKNILKNYEVSREKIYVGEVIKPSILHKYSDGYKDFMTGEDKSGELATFGWFSYRSMLFTPNEESLASDLLYSSPNYPILNMSSDELCFSSNIVIKDYINLSLLLQYLEYKDTLTIEDLIKIRKTIFNGRFGMDNCELFGFKETKPEDYTYYKNGEKVTDPKELQKFINKERASQAAGHRSFSSYYQDHLLPSGMMNEIDQLGDNSLYDVFMGFDDRMDSFKPSRSEGQIKKLTRF